MKIEKPPISEEIGGFRHMFQFINLLNEFFPGFSGITGLILKKTVDFVNLIFI